MSEIEQKWGFGMAPFKKKTEILRVGAAQSVLGLFVSGYSDDATNLLDQISEVKGLFNRSYRQDQWDWFTTWVRLNRPSRPAMDRIAKGLTKLRIACKDGDSQAFTEHAARLEFLGIIKYLDAFVSADSRNRPGGEIYILSTRENRDILKVGYTTRAVEQRVKEINSATGVVTPYGVRAVWCVSDARSVEQDVHTLLEQYRIRKDREFFRVDFKEAFKIIYSYIRSKRLEQNLPNDA